MTSDESPIVSKLYNIMNESNVEDMVEEMHDLFREAAQGFDENDLKGVGPYLTENREEFHRRLQCSVFKINYGYSYIQLETVEGSILSILSRGLHILVNALPEHLKNETLGLLSIRNLKATLIRFREVEKLSRRTGPIIEQKPNESKTSEESDSSSISPSTQRSSRECPVEHLERKLSSASISCVPSDVGPVPPFEKSTNSEPSQHGGEQKEDIRKGADILQLPKCTNILLLGETGVGKSTFINAFANYFNYTRLEDAIEGGVRTVIKSAFCMTDDNYEQVVINCLPTLGDEQDTQANQVLSPGDTATQNPKSYKFSFGQGENQKIVRFIDTPGLEDIRGPDQDEKNFQNILHFISQFNEIHGICILLPPNMGRQTISLSYYMGELLSHLHRSARANIIFCFTNTRGTLYRPGETLSSIRKFLKELTDKTGIEIPLNRDMIFSLDNECFRFLSALKENIIFDDSEKHNFACSWKHSIDETLRLFDRITKLPVHYVRDTMSVNNTRNIIRILSKPLSEIQRLNMINKQLIEKKMEEVSKHRAAALNLQGKLNMVKVINLLGNLTMVQVADPSIRERIAKNDEVINADQMFIAALQKQVDELTNESEKIASHCAEFATYLTKNSILPYNDSFESYIDYRIVRKKDEGSQSGRDEEFVHQMQNYKRKHEEEVRILNTSMQSKVVNVKNASEINDMIEELRNMKHFAEFLQEVKKFETCTSSKIRLNETIVPMESSWLSTRNRTNRGRPEVNNLINENTYI